MAVLTIPIQLAVNLQTLLLAGDYAGFAPQIPTLVQGNIKDLVIVALQPTGSVTSAEYTVANLQGYSMTVTISTTPNGEGTQTVLAQNSAMAWNPASSQFTGSLDLTSANLDTAIGAASQIQATLEIELIVNGVRQTIFQGQVTIIAPADPGTVTNPIPGASYLTAAQIAAGYVPQVGAPGQGFIMVSPGGTRVYISVNDAGALIPEILTS